MQSCVTQPEDLLSGIGNPPPESPTQSSELRTLIQNGHVDVGSMNRVAPFRQTVGDVFMRSINTGKFWNVFNRELEENDLEVNFRGEWFMKVNYLVPKSPNLLEYIQRIESAKSVVDESRDASGAALQEDDITELFGDFKSLGGVLIYAKTNRDFLERLRSLQIRFMPEHGYAYLLEE